MSSPTPSSSLEASPSPAATADTKSSDPFKIPLLSIRAGPLDGDWLSRLKQEVGVLVKLQTENKRVGHEWFSVSPSNSAATQWKGKCWTYHQYHRYEFDLCFELPVGYPESAFEICLPELDGKTIKMFRGGKICLAAHFQPLWQKNVPHFGIAHALTYGLAPWLAAEVPNLVDQQQIDESNSYKTKDKNSENDKIL